MEKIGHWQPKQPNLATERVPKVFKPTNEITLYAGITIPPYFKDYIIKVYIVGSVRIGTALLYKPWNCENN